MPVTCTCTPRSCPTVRLNSCTSRSTGRACLLAVNVPEGQGDRLLFIQQRFFPAAGESKNKGAEQQKREKALFHKEPSKTELVFAKEGVIFEIS